MNKEEYRKTLDVLGLTIAGKRTARLLGVQPRQSQNYAAGTKIHGAVILLLRIYLRHGIPDWL
jgi:hypothetical protein